MGIKRIIISSLITGAILLSGCAGPSLLDQNWGRSAVSARYNQTLNPQAGQNLAPVEGLDGTSAENSMTTYHNSFLEPEQSSGYDIKVTGIGTKK